MACRDLLVGQVLILDRSALVSAAFTLSLRNSCNHQIKGRSWEAGRQQGRALHVGTRGFGGPSGPKASCLHFELAGR
jgi:hypothetical protein